MRKLISLFVLLIMAISCTQPQKQSQLQVKDTKALTMAVITEDWTIADIRNELLCAKRENKVPTYKEPHLLYNVKTNPTLNNIEKFISIVGEEGYNIKLKDADVLINKRNYL